MKVKIERTVQDDYQTLGELIIPELNFRCKTLELPWLDNRQNVSCIPGGSYMVKKRNSNKFGDHFHIQDVPQRSFILIHSGNYKADVKGCILVGREHKDINGDGHDDVTSSKDTMKDLNDLLPEEFQLDLHYCHELSTSLPKVNEDDKTTKAEKDAESGLDTDVSGKYLVNVDTKLNLREGPGTQYQIIAKLESGQPLFVSKIIEGWAQVQMDEHTSVSGYASSAYLIRVEN